MNLLKDFFLLNTWEVWVLMLTTIVLLLGMWLVIKKYKLAFHWRVLIGLTIGLVIALTVQGIAGFPDQAITDSRNNNPDFNLGVQQYSNWMGLLKKIFINGIRIMVVPLVFLAILRVFSKKGKEGLGWVTTKGILILLTNVAVAFGVTFWIGYAVGLGKGFDITADSQLQASHTYKSLPALIGGYVPSSFFSTLVSGSIVSVIVLAGVVGIAIRRLSSSSKTSKYFKNTESIYEMFWKIINSILIYFIKIMPYAIVAMIGNAIITRPIGQMKTIGMILAVGYMGIIIMFGYHTLTMWASGIKVGKMWSKSWKPVLIGFTSQSSMATLPVALETMKDDLNFKGDSQRIVQPLSTTIGLTGCAGVQSGVILSLFWGATRHLIGGGDHVIPMTLAAYFFTGIIVTVIVSFGIAGVPGTATIVTQGVMSSLSFTAFAGPTMAIISSLNGVFDMGRTAVNVHGGIQASAICAKGQGELPDELVWRKGKLIDFSPIFKKLRIGKKPVVSKQDEKIS